MKLKHLRDHCRSSSSFDLSFDGNGWKELLEDIDKEIFNARQQGVQLGRHEEREQRAKADWALKMNQSGHGGTAPASSELGVELSKIRDRLNALELWKQRVGDATKPPGTA